MENNWPEAVDELLEECQRLISRCDLYTLGERGEPLPGEAEPRVDGTDYLAGEYRYGVAMIPAQWVTHVIDAATLGSEPDEIELTQTYDAGFRNGVMAVFQQLEGIEDYEGLQDLIAEYWGESEGNDE